MSIRIDDSPPEAGIPGPPAGEIIEHLFRHQSGTMVAHLCRRMGAEHFSLAEDAVQDALLKAMRFWPFHGIPPDPAGWLLQTARHRALDLLRQKNRATKYRASLRSFIDWPRSDNAEEGADDQLRMIFACCHPCIQEESRVALTLKVVCGFGLREIARALMSAEKTVAQRIVRAKREFKKGSVTLAFPGPEEFHARLDAVLRVVYLTFNEGYCTLESEELLREDLCDEAIRLTGLLLRNQGTSVPSVHALRALFLFQRARFASRVNTRGELCLLSDQDRTLWDQSRIAEGLYHLERSASGDEETTYHLEAAIASHHVTASSYAGTRWPELLDLYDRLLLKTNSPVVALNRAVVLAKCEGPREGLRVLGTLKQEARLRQYYLLFATMAELEWTLGHVERAADYVRQAIEKTRNRIERELLVRRLELYQVPSAEC